MKEKLTQGDYKPIRWDDIDGRRGNLFEEFDSHFMGEFERLETVDQEGIGFYGLSQGGQSALWLPAADNTHQGQRLRGLL